MIFGKNRLSQRLSPRSIKNNHQTQSQQQNSPKPPTNQNKLNNKWKSWTPFRATTKSKTKHLSSATHTKLILKTIIHVKSPTNNTSPSHHHQFSPIKHLKMSCSSIGKNWVKKIDSNLESKAISPPNLWNVTTQKFETLSYETFSEKDV